MKSHAFEEVSNRIAENFNDYKLLIGHNTMNNVIAALHFSLLRSGRELDLHQYVPI